MAPSIATDQVPALEHPTDADTTDPLTSETAPDPSQEQTQPIRRVDSATTPMMPTSETCGYCQTDIDDGQSAFRCPGCGTKYHDDCWAENEGCAIPGCSAAPGSQGPSEQGAGPAQEPYPHENAGPRTVNAPGANLDGAPAVSSAREDAWGPPRKRRSRLPTWLMVGIPVLILLLVGGGLFVLLRKPSHDLSATYTLLDSSGFRVEGGACYPEGGYSDVDSFTQANVSDASGTILATTEIGDGTVSTVAGFSVCQYSFDFGNVPMENIYQVSIGGRGSITFTKQELESNGWTAQLTLGDLGGI